MPDAANKPIPTPASLAAWQAVALSDEADMAELRAAVEASDLSDAHRVAAVAKLRKRWDAEPVRIALQLAEARRRAADKFGEFANTLIADVEGVQQASSLAVAMYKATRMSQALGRDAAIADICCGIGGDTIALARAGMRVTAIDRDPVKAWMAEANALAFREDGSRCRRVVLDVCEEETIAPLLQTTDAFHIDPARRNDAGRVWRLEDYVPGPDAIAMMLRHCPTAAIKLGPGVDPDAIPQAFHQALASLDGDGAQTEASHGELEFISEDGRLVQAVLWTGKLAAGQGATTRATRIQRSPEDALGYEATTLHSPASATQILPIAEPDRYLFSIDPAIERAGLEAELCESLDLAAIHPKLGLLTGPTQIASPWLTAFELLEVMPWREPRVKQWLAEHGAGEVTIKTRGKAVDPDPLQKRLRGPGDRPLVVFVLRFDDRLIALIARRLG